MKIAYICPFYSPAIGGVKQVVQELAERSVKEGHNVHVYTSDWDKYKRIKKEEDTINGVYVHRCKHLFKVANFASFWPSVFSKLLKEDFDIIHSHVFGHPHTFLATLAGKIKNTPTIHTTHCPWSDAYRSPMGRFLMWIGYRTIGRLSFRWSKYIIAITPWEYQFIQKYGGKRRKIINIPNGMDEILYKKIKPNRFKKQHKIKGKVILFFGRLSPTKGPEKLAQVGKEIVKKRKDVNFVFLGPDEGMKETVKRIIKDQPRMFLLDPIRNKKKIAEMYQAADIYCLPSYREGLPLTLFEAMASGLPIIASPVNGIPYEMKETENGFFVKYGDLKNLKDKILKLLDNKRLSKEISNNNIKKAKKYNWDKIYKKTTKLYENAKENINN